MAERAGFVPKIAIFWANITQFVAQFKYTPREFGLTQLYNLLTLLLTVLIDDLIRKVNEFGGVRCSTGIDWARFPKPWCSPEVNSTSSQRP